jgi:hypothetical protein
LIRPTIVIDPACKKLAVYTQLYNVCGIDT